MNSSIHAACHEQGNIHESPFISQENSSPVVDKTESESFQFFIQLHHTLRLSGRLGYTRDQYTDRWNFEECENLNKFSKPTMEYNIGMTRNFTMGK